MLELIKIKELDPKIVKQWNIGRDKNYYHRFNDKLFHSLCKDLINNWEIKESEEELFNQEVNIIKHIPAYLQIPALRKLIDNGEITEWDAIDYIRFIEDWHHFKLMYKRMGKEALWRVVRP